MRRRGRSREHRPAVFAAALVGLVWFTQATLVAIAAPPVDLPGPPSADGIVPVMRDTRSSSDDCGELGFDHGVSLSGNGSVSAGDVTVTGSGYNSPTGFVDWTSNLPIHGVYVKGGRSGGNLFSYPAGDTGDRNLHTPRRPDGGFYAVSHVSACWNDATPAPDVTVTKENEPAGMVTATDTITYTLRVTNAGDGDAAAVVLTDALPPGVAFVSATAGCAEDAGVVTCALGDIGPAATVALEIIVSVDDGACGSIANVASVAAANEPAAAAANNDSNDVTNVVECAEPDPPDVAVTKTSSAGGVLTEGDTFTYTITVTNQGDAEATGVRFVDTLPAGEPLSVDLSSFPTFGGLPCTLASSESPGGIRHTTLHCGPIALAPGEAASVELAVEVNGSSCGPLVNEVDVEATNEPPDNVGPDNHAETSDAIACPPAIHLEKSGTELAHVGDTVTYTFAVRNPGGVDLTGVQLTDPGCDGPIDLVDGGDGDATLAQGERWDFRCDHAIAPADGDPVPNTATVVGSSDAGTVTDSDAHDVDVLHPSIAIDKSPSPASGVPGTSIRYGYTVTNTGDTRLYDISIDDDLLGHVGDIASLAPGQSATRTADGTLGPSPVTNIGTASGADVLGRVVVAEDAATVVVVSAGGSGDGRDGSPFTGAPSGGWILGAVLSFAAGAAALVGTRRPSRAAR